jgi:hypothetical protein
MEETKNTADKLAKTVSVIFHPLLMPVYGLLIIFSAPTLYGYLPFAVKKLLFLIILVNNVLLPISILPFLIHWNLVSSWSLDSRKERIQILIITTMLYITTSFIIYNFPIPLFLKTFIFGVSFLSLVVLGINFWWKISIHSVGIGALVSIVLLLSFKMYTPLIWYIISALVVGGMVMSSRLHLDAHNPRQVWYGFSTGFVGLTLFIMLF